MINNPDISQRDLLYTYLDAKEPLPMSARLQYERGGRSELDVKDVVAQERCLIISDTRHGQDHRLEVAHSCTRKQTRRGDFKELLDDGTLAIFLDGLDLLEGSEDFEPVAEIQNFMPGFSRCKFVLPSRPMFLRDLRVVVRSMSASDLPDSHCPHQR